MRLKEGDGVALQGTLKAEIWTPEGKEPRINQSIMIDGVLALRPAPRPRKQQPEQTRETQSAPASQDRHQLAKHAGDGTDYFHDDINF